MKNHPALFALLCTTAMPLAYSADRYQIDSTHSFANFSVRHVVSRTSGTFNNVTGQIVLDQAEPAKSSVTARIGVASINTGFAKRDEHLREKPEYLEPAKFAEMTFTSSKVVWTEKADGVPSGGMLTGQFSLHGVTREISFPFKLLGVGNDPWGGQRAGFEAHTTLNAADYGFGWAATPNGPIGAELEVTLLIEAIKEKTK